MISGAPGRAPALSVPQTRRIALPWAHVVALVLALVGVRLIPVGWCSRNAGGWYSGDAGLQQRLAQSVEGWISSGLTEQDFTTGSPHFDGEWLFGSYMMAGMGFGQLAQQDPANRQRYLEQMERCIDRLLSRPVRRFDHQAWGGDPIAALGPGGGDHAAYLGYLNLLLSFHRSLEPRSRFAALNDRITRALARRLQRSPLHLLQTFPREVFPVDNSAVVGSIGLHARATGGDHSALLERWARQLRRRYVDPETGLLFQRVHHTSGSRIDAPRGSGTALAVYFLSFSHPELSRQLYRALKNHLGDTLLGFGLVREYPAAFAHGAGDIDSGPIVLGYGVSATGFSLAGSRIHGDRAFFRRLMATVALFGAPLGRGDELDFVSGGPLGNAIMLAMLTARPRAAAATVEGTP